MTLALARARLARWLTSAIVATAASVATDASAQAAKKPLLQLEVGDSIGLPLPDATLEVFTFMEGGVFAEWVTVGPSDLPPGINLLRFSHPGYRRTVFSVPLREGSTVALRVRLRPERDTTK